MTIRGLSPKVKERLRIRAARHGRSMEEEVRVILRSAVSQADARPARLGSAIHSHFVGLGGVELDLPTRERIREPPKLG
jgi:plasmid stability protein